MPAVGEVDEDSVPLQQVSQSLSRMSCVAASRQAVVALSLSERRRSFTALTLPTIVAFAAKVGAAYHLVASLSHPSLAPHQGSAALNPRFLKLPVLEYFLARYSRVLYVDDDVIFSPGTPDLFALVPCAALGVVVEHHQPPGWHALHLRNACALYGSCEPPRGGSKSEIWNSGLLLLTAAPHAASFSRWRAANLTCRVLCDQLYLNAVSLRDQLPLTDLGPSFNYVGSELRRAMTAPIGRERGPEELARRRAGLRAACVLHLTRKVPKPVTAHWLIRRSLVARDVLQCEVAHARWPEARGWRDRLLVALPPPPPGKLAAQLCGGKGEPCELQAWVG